MSTIFDKLLYLFEMYVIILKSNTASSEKISIKRFQRKDHVMENKRHLTLLSVVSCLAVIFLHTNSRFWEFSWNFDWISALIIETVFYFAVPSFFMISGATLINYRDRYDTKTFIKKRLVRTVIPYLLWSFIYFFIGLATGAYALADISFRWFVSGILTNRFCDVFWFFTTIIACYLCIPLLSLIPKEHRIKIYCYTVAIGVITVSLLPLVCQLSGISYNTNLTLPLIGNGYIMFMLIGYVLSETELSPKIRVVIYLLGLTGLLLHAVGTAAFSYEAGSIDSTFKGYTNIPSVLYATAVFVFFKYLPNGKVTGVIHKAAARISSATLGIYLIHMILIDTVIRKSTDINYNHILFRTFGAIGIFAVCALTVKLVQKIPILKKIFP